MAFNEARIGGQMVAAQQQIWKNLGITGSSEMSMNARATLDYVVGRVWQKLGSEAALDVIKGAEYVSRFTKNFTLTYDFIEALGKTGNADAASKMANELANIVADARFRESDKNLTAEDASMVRRARAMYAAERGIAAVEALAKNKEEMERIGSLSLVLVRIAIDSKMNDPNLAFTGNLRRVK